MVMAMSDDIHAAEKAVEEIEQRVSQLEEKRKADPLLKAKAELEAARDRVNVLRAANERAAILEQAKARALKLKEAVRDLREVGKNLDEIAEDLVRHSQALLLGARELRRSGAAAPSDDQCLTLWRSLNGYLQQSIWKRSFEIIPPNERKPFAHHINVWCDRADGDANRTLQAIDAEQQQTKAA
jgi:DNA repair exonuclease SbcCD ATPase subunit